MKAGYNRKMVKPGLYYSTFTILPYEPSGVYITIPLMMPVYVAG